MDDFGEFGGRAVPQGRAARLARLGALTTGVAGGMAVEAARSLAAGRRPSARELLLTPANARRVADRLAQMRGAAMKVGQLMSMEAEDVLPPEWGIILGRLRDQADFMPPRQLKEVLIAEWGRDFLRRLKRFDVRPIAAASIGQVHRAEALDGAPLAIKVQYPGVAKSIDADVDNVYSLIKMSGLAPDGLDLAPLMEEAKKQLHQEADYLREAECLTRYRGLVGDWEGFVVPEAVSAFNTKRILAMSFVAGAPIDELGQASQATRDRAVERLMRLALAELFDFRFMQTDPNFANYRFEPETGRIVLLDFGAAQEISEEISDGYRAMLRAGMNADWDALERTATDLGFIPSGADTEVREKMLSMAAIVFRALRRPGPFDFSDGRLAAVLRDEGRRLAEDGAINELPRFEALLIQRKMGGVYQLAHRLRARVDTNALVRSYLD